MSHDADFNLVYFQTNSAEIGDDGQVSLTGPKFRYKKPETVEHVKNCLANYRSVMAR